MPASLGTLALTLLTTKSRSSFTDLRAACLSAKGPIHPDASK